MRKHLGLLWLTIALVVGLWIFYALGHSLNYVWVALAVVTLWVGWFAWKTLKS